MPEPNPNEQLQDFLIAHQIGLRRLSTGEVRELLRIVERTQLAIRQQMTASLNVISPRVAAHFGLYDTLADIRSIPELKRMYAQINALQRELASELYARLAGDLEAFAAYENDYMASLVAKLAPAGVTWELASPLMLEQIVKSRPFEGKLLGEHFRDLRKVDRAAAVKMRQLVEEGILTGRPTRAIVLEVNGAALGLDRRAVEAYVRTAISHVSNEMRDELGQLNADIVAGYRWVGALDSRICSLCIVRDGHKYDLNYEPIDGGPPWDAGPGRLHWGDRCTSTYVLRGEEELREGEALRAAEGRAVDATVTAEDWVNKQDELTLRKMFGPQRARLLTRGDLDLVDLVRRDGTLYRLEDLARHDRLAFEKAGIPIARFPGAPAVRSEFGI